MGEMSEDIGKALPESFRSKFVKDLEYIFNDKLVAEFFIRKVAPNRSFEYTWGNKTIECSFLSDNSLHHFIDFVSSQSTMHRITKFNLDEAYIDYVDPRCIEVIKEKVNNPFNSEMNWENYSEVDGMKFKVTCERI